MKFFMQPTVDRAPQERRPGLPWPTLIDGLAVCVAGWQIPFLSPAGRRLRVR